MVSLRFVLKGEKRHFEFAKLSSFSFLLPSLLIPDMMFVFKDDRVGLVKWGPSITIRLAFPSFF
jgi:hypothetical protein